MCRGTLACKAGRRGYLPRARARTGTFARLSVFVDSRAFGHRRPKCANIVVAVCLQRLRLALARMRRLPGRGLRVKIASISQCR